MNKYVKNLSRIEFVVTYACTGRCKHCSEGDHLGQTAYVDAETAKAIIKRVAGVYEITSVMTFGGEPLLHPEVVYAVHDTARQMGIEERHLITNGFFSKDSGKIRQVAEALAQCGVNKVLLSVDAFHQETIPLAPVKEFALHLKELGVPLWVQPAWVVNKEHENPYNQRTKEILAEFEALGIPQTYGNDIVPRGNAAKYLSEYYDMSKEYTSPYDDDPRDIRTISVDSSGEILGGNVFERDILEILENYVPQ